MPAAKKQNMVEEELDVMRALPKNWRWQRLESVAQVVAGQSPPSSVVNQDNHGLPFFQGKADFGASHPNARYWCQSPKKIAEAGDVLISVRAPVGPTNYAVERSGIGRGLAAIRPVHVSERYIRYWLMATSDVLRSKATGTTFEAITGDVLRSHPIPIPPDGRDRKIVARIDELFAEIDEGEAALARARDNLATWRRSLLKAAVTGKLTADWRTDNPISKTGADLLTDVLEKRRIYPKVLGVNNAPRYKEPVRPALYLFDQLPELPLEWTWASVAQLTTLVTSGSRGWAKHYSTAGAAFIRAQNIKTDQLCLRNVAYVRPPDGGEGTRTKVCKGDILITITGANVTKSALVDIELDEAYVSQHVGLLRPVDKALSRYLYWWIITPTGGRAILEKLAYGAGKPGLNLPNLLGLPVPLPPRIEQNEINRMCASLERSYAESCEVAIELEGATCALRQSILAAAFRGELA